MENKTVIITGASDGIGAEAARQLHHRGLNVVLIGRSPEKTKKRAEELGVKYYLADFTRLDEVRRLASQIQQDYPHIDVLLNNAGGIFNRREITVDGHEKTFQINHLAHFLLTNLLLDTLIKSKASVINVSSTAHLLFSRMDIHNLELEHGYSERLAYGNAKLANILFTKELHRRYHDQGISTAAVHPGVIATNFAHSSSIWFRIIYHTPARLMMESPALGADPLVWLATSTPGKDWQSGEYYEKRKVSKPNSQALDPALARELWDISVADTQLQLQNQ